MAEIRLTGVNKVYPGGTHAVHDVDLHIADGEFMIMVGPSGCAKSTILRMIAGLETPTGGTIEIGGRVVNDVAPKDRDIAMVFQSYALYPHMTVRENMAFGLRLRRMPPAEIDQRVAEAARILGLEQLLDRLPKAMSGGQRQRVAMGRAIVREPQAFLMDEPLSNLDAKLRVQMRTEIAKLHQRLSTTTVYVTHDQVEAMTLGQRICILRKGVVQQVDTPFQVYTNPANVFVGGFMGSPGMNFMTGHLMLHDGMLFLRVGEQNLPVPASVSSRLTATTDLHGRGVIVGIRPEHLSLSTESDTGAIPVQVELTEAMGSEVYAYFTAAVATPDLRELSDTQATADTFVARLASGTETRGGERIMLRPDLDEVHLFDAQSMLTLLAPAEEADVRARQSGTAIKLATGVAGSAGPAVVAPPTAGLLQPVQPGQHFLHTPDHLHQTIMQPEQPTYGTLGAPATPAIASVFDQPVAAPFEIQPLVVGASPGAVATSGGTSNPHVAHPRPTFAQRSPEAGPTEPATGPYARLGLPAEPAGMDWATPTAPVEPASDAPDVTADPLAQPSVTMQPSGSEQVEAEPMVPANRGFAPRMIGAPHVPAAAPATAAAHVADGSLALPSQDIDEALAAIEQVEQVATPNTATLSGFAPLGADAGLGGAGFRDALARIRTQRSTPVVTTPSFGSTFSAPRISIDPTDPRDK